jgi:hypothetical protein
LAVTAYVVVIVAMGLVQHFVPSFHDFRQRQHATMMWPVAEQYAERPPTAEGGGE